MAKEYRYLVLCVLLLLYSCIHAFPDRARPRALSLRSTHILGGEIEDIEKLPYQLSIQMLLLHTCGAAIISPKYALTAAHCNLFSGFMLRTITITAGSSTLYWGGQWHYVENTISHPKYKSDDQDYDVAVFKVRNPFPTTNKIKPVPLPTQSQSDFLDFDKPARVSGWGVSEDFISIWLRKVDVPLISHLKCQQLYKKTRFEITPRMLCAGGQKKGDSCQGDSGGPMVHKGHLIGLTSWGVGCNVFPGVYTNLFDPDIRSFITSNTDK